MLDRRLQELEALQARWNGLNEEGKQLDVAEEEAMKEADRLKRAPQLAAIRARIIACAESALRLDTQIQRVRADIDALTDSIKGRAHQLHEAHQLQGERKLKR
ncbi:hypothetical protein ASE10_09265 [Lysobacter sp. Root76]|nr:hypothetical protein ASE10_09265 [Lysobacter sp. Root76]KRD70556.1 hypothetical protein ASE45_01435 [Lysobacter sp. Root96]